MESRWVAPCMRACCKKAVAEQRLAGRLKGGRGQKVSGPIYLHHHIAAIYLQQPPRLHVQSLGKARL